MYAGDAPPYILQPWKAPFQRYTTKVSQDIFIDSNHVQNRHFAKFDTFLKSYKVSRDIIIC